MKMARRPSTPRLKHQEAPSPCDEESGNDVEQAADLEDAQGHDDVSDPKQSVADPLDPLSRRVS
jgi:hypothetical protein